MSSPTKPTLLDIAFEKKFNATVSISFLGEGFLYSPKKENEPSYELFSLTKNEIDTLMEQSLKEDKDLLFEACKDKPYDEIKEYERLGIKF